MALNPVRKKQNTKLTIGSTSTVRAHHRPQDAPAPGGAPGSQCRQRSAPEAKEPPASGTAMKLLDENRMGIKRGQK